MMIPFFCYTIKMGVLSIDRIVECSGRLEPVNPEYGVV